MVKFIPISPAGWCLILEQARLYTFMTLSTPSSVPQIQFQTTPTGTTPPVAESIEVSKTLDLSTSEYFNCNR